MEVLLRDCPSSAVLCWRWREEKKDVFDAVIGVVGVFALILIGGVRRPLALEAASLVNCAIFSSVGVLKGSRFNGGRRSGWSCFFCAGGGG